jgi:hypothetical protein
MTAKAGPQTKTVDNYIAGLEGGQREVAVALRQLIRKAAPRATEAIKWAQPVYDVNGPICYFRAFKRHVNFGFWRGAQLKDPHGLLESTGDKMGHIKLTGVGDIRKAAFQALVREAVRLNQKLGDPSRIR